MAYTLESLKQSIDLVLLCWSLDEESQIESLLEKVNLLKDFLENSLPISSERTESLEIQIRDAANKAEDIIESHIGDRFLPKSEVDMDERHQIFSRNLQELIEEFDSIKEELIKIVDKSQIQNSQTKISSLPDVSSRTESSTNNTMVGYDEDINQLKERLTGQQSALQIIPIIGMGGIGKTTLARNLYDDPYIVYHFDTRAWITISQEYNVREILLGFLDCIRELTDDMHQKKEYQLAEHLYKSLKGRRYLIVLDDMWSTKAWDDIKMSFPDDDNGSRIMITTRELNVANYADSLCLHHQMHLLNKDESWNLLRDKVFAQEQCPLEFENFGKNIARSCAGLPLAISVMAGILSTAKSAIDLWEHIARNVSSAATRNDDHFLKILSLSYNHLPHHLKPCFLYMGAFPEDYEIRASKLIRLWVAEGFVKPVIDKSLEEAAEMYLKALVDKNLILACQKESNGKVKSYKIHDLLRDLCVMKASEEKFLFVKNRRVSSFPENTISLRRVSTHSSFSIRNIYGSMDMMKLARSFLCIGPASHAILSPVFLGLRLLRVLDVIGIDFYSFPVEILQLVNLGYLAFKCQFELPSSINRLWKLQTLIYGELGICGLPFKILDMPHLRHLKAKHVWLYGTIFARENLQTLTTVNIYEYIKELEAFPNLKKLGFVWGDTKVDIRNLHRLETLKCSSALMFGAHSCLSDLSFPQSLKKLTLSRCSIPLKSLTTLGSLPNLQVLKLRNCKFQSPDVEQTEEEWEPTEGEFCQLELLVLEKLNLVHWRADFTHFPFLRRLVIRDCSALKEIPCGIGESPALELIEVENSSPSAVASARQIQEEQRDLGNDGLQVCIYGAS